MIDRGLWPKVEHSAFCASGLMPNSLHGLMKRTTRNVALPDGAQSAISSLILCSG